MDSPDTREIAARLKKRSQNPKQCSVPSRKSHPMKELMAIGISSVTNDVGGKFCDIKKIGEISDLRPRRLNRQQSHCNFIYNTYHLSTTKDEYFF